MYGPIEKKEKSAGTSAYVFGLQLSLAVRRLSASKSYDRGFEPPQVCILFGCM